MAMEKLKPMRSPSRVSVDRKSTRLNSSHVSISYAVFCLKKKMLLMGAHHAGADRQAQHRPRALRQQLVTAHPAYPRRYRGERRSGAGGVLRLAAVAPWTARDSTRMT